MKRLIKRGFPAIFSDIDGVLSRQNLPIKGTIKALKYIRKPLYKISRKFEALDV